MVWDLCVPAVGQLIQTSPMAVPLAIPLQMEHFQKAPKLSDTGSGIS